MKRLILLVALSGSFSGVAQTTGGIPGMTDGTGNYSGDALGGVMGNGGTKTTIQQTTPSQAPDSKTENLNLGIPRGTEVPMQRMEERTNYAGGSLGGDSNINIPFVPSTGQETYTPDTPVTPSVPPAEVELPRTNGRTTPSDGTPVP